MRSTGLEPRIKEQFLCKLTPLPVTAVKNCAAAHSPQGNLGIRTGKNKTRQQLSRSIRIGNKSFTQTGHLVNAIAEVLIKPNH